VDCTFHALPDHTSATVDCPAGPLYAPTAVQAAVEVKDTPFMNEVCAPVGFGIVWIFHPRPFHFSARANSPLLALT
jgi:hypothetical protein